MLSNTSRYSRQALVLGTKEQRNLEKKRVVIVGVGALGSTAAELLTRAGIGHLSIIDRDVVETTNLQRQLLYTEKDIGKPKAQVAAARLRQINTSVSIQPRVMDLNFQNIHLLLTHHDLILDGTDNLATRFLINEYARKMGIAWIYAGAIQDHGTVMTITPKTPCFRCIFEETNKLETCDTVGVLNTTTTIVGALQVQEALTLLTQNNTEKKDAGTVKRQQKQDREQHLIHLTLHPLHIASVKTKKDPDCPVCQGDYAYLEGKKEPKVVCHECSELYSFFRDDISIPALRKKLEKIGPVKGTDQYLFFQNLSIFANGKVLIKATSLHHAKATIAKYLGM